MNTAIKKVNKPKKNHPWRQYGSDWLKKDNSQKFTSSLIGGTHYQHGKRPC